MAEGVDRRQRQIILGKMDKLEDEKVALQEYVMQEKAALELDIPDRNELLLCFQKAQEMFREQSLEEMQQLIDLYLEKIIVHEDEVEVILNLVPIFYRHSFTRQVHVIKRKELREKKRNH